jgi:hypothetical protein
MALPIFLLYWFITGLISFACYLVFLNSIDTNMKLPFSWLLLVIIVGLPAIVILSPIAVPTIYLYCLCRDYPKFMQAIKGNND